MTRLILKILILPLLTILIGCDGNSGAPSSSGKAKAPSKSFEGYANRGIDNSWPALEEDVANVDTDKLSYKNYYIIFDGSGSMGKQDCGGGRAKILAAKDAVSRFVDQIPADANIGVAGFDTKGMTERLSLFGSNKQKALQAIKSFSANGGTPLNSAITLGYRSLEKQAQRQLGYGEYHLIVVTDGQASRGEDPTGIVQQIALTSPVLIHTIGFCVNLNHSLNRPGVVLYKSASDPQSLAAGLEAVLAESDQFDITQFSN